MLALLALGVCFSASAFDPRSLGLDLACSACTLTSNAVELQLAALGAEAEAGGDSGGDGGGGGGGSLSARMSARMERHCASLSNIAQSGPAGAREYVDLGMALRQVRLRAADKCG